MKLFSPKYGYTHIAQARKGGKEREAESVVSTNAARVHGRRTADFGIVYRRAADTTSPCAGAGGSIFAGLFKFWYFRETLTALPRWPPRTRSRPRRLRMSSAIGAGSAGARVAR
eukprot:361275-Chlamydomonas_euryale.AAC.2